ncbi:MAG: YjgP/YjgQ family permease [SAR324 cluster bacterium]|nr:YjgP/YjgQ family permease [SAR324 cluster bacterium]
MLLFFYIVKELLFPFFLSTGIITSIMLMDQIFKFIPFLQASGLEMKSVVQMILYSLSPILFLACPVSVLIGFYAGINRLSSDYELVVMRASGVSISYIFKPVIFVAVLIAGLVMILTFYIGPYGISKLEELKFNILKKHTKIQLSVNRVNDLFGKKLIYIFEKEGELLRGILIADRTLGAQYSVIEATEGKIYFDDRSQKILFRLSRGKIHNYQGEKAYRIISFDRLDYDLAPPQEARRDLPTRFRLNQGNTRAYKTDTELTVDELLLGIRQMPKSDPLYYDYLDELHARIVTILSCICLAIFAVPMGIFDPRSPKAGNIIYMIAVMLIYFMLYAQIRALLLQGRVPPAALYLPLLFALGLGMISYFKVNHNYNSVLEILRVQFHQLRKSHTKDE